ncbi:hypothetical protein L0F63_003261 [Massospora cicadina]|nr:hypothetical protein L0F63_003261 [Massospora cicadina]
MLEVEAAISAFEDMGPDPNSYFCRAKDIAETLLKRKAVGAVLAYVGVSGEPPEPGSPEFESLPLLHQLAAQGGGQALTYDQGRLLAQEVMISPDIRQTACFYGELFVGDRLGLPTVGYLQSKAAECFSFKNCSLNAPHPHITSIVPHVAGRNTETQNKSPSATEGQFVKKEERELWERHHSKNLVDAILEDAAQGVFKISKAIRILGFISRDKAKRVHFMEEPILLQARSHPDAFDVLVTSMYRTKKVGIVWYLRSSNITRITFGYLVPCRATSENASYFQFFRIPFSQDVQTSLLPSLDDLPYFVCTPDQPDELKVPGAINLPKPLLEATEEFIHAMMLL